MLCYVWVSEWNSGCGRVAYVVWRPGDFGGPVRVVVCVVCRAWLVGYGDGGEEGVTIFVSRGVWCFRDRAVWWCGRVDLVCMLFLSFLG